MGLRTIGCGPVFWPVCLMLTISPVGPWQGRGGGRHAAASNCRLAPVWAISGPSHCSISEGVGPGKISSECTEMSFPLQKCLEAVLASIGSGRLAPKGFAGQRSAIPRIQLREHCTTCTDVQGQPIAVGGL